MKAEVKLIIYILVAFGFYLQYSVVRLKSIKTKFSKQKEVKYATTGNNIPGQPKAYIQFSQEGLWTDEISDFESELNRKKRSTIQYDRNEINTQNIFTPKPVLRPEYGALFEHQGFLLQGLQRTYLFVAIQLPSENDLLHEPPNMPSCKN